MYANPVLLPQFTNREDILLTISIADDDTQELLNLAGITLGPSNPNGYTGALWTVTVGTVITSSVTSLTIPGYPITTQLQSKSLTVGTGLSIAAGSTVVIADTATGLNTMTGYVTSYNSTTGALVCQIGFTFQFEIRRPSTPNGQNSGYVTWYDFGVQNDAGPLISAALGTGISFIDLGIIQILIPESTVKSLCEPSTYRASLTMTDSVNTRQLFIAQLPIFAGGVSV